MKLVAAFLTIQGPASAGRSIALKAEYLADSGETLSAMAKLISMEGEAMLTHLGELLAASAGDPQASATAGPRPGGMTIHFETTGDKEDAALLTEV